MPQPSTASSRMTSSTPTRADRPRTTAVRKGPPRYESFTFSDLNIRLYGDVGVLTGFVDVKMVGRDSFRVRTLQVYTKKDGHWQMAAHQSTRIGN
jgi:hypothetical protein